MLASALPAPMPSPPPPAGPDSLAVRINTTTRQTHTELNRLITARIPLALPPYSDSPDLYLHGIHVFAQLFYVFEDAWQDLICVHLATTRNPSDTNDVANHSHRVAAFLSQLVESRLWRTQRLEADIEHLRTTRNVSLPDLDKDKAVVEIRERIAASVAAKPHVLLAYSWVMYMAIFSGGRWIRSQLLEQNHDFWMQETQQEKGTHAGFSLFYFDGLEDGEDIKAGYKRRFAEADTVLTDDEKRDVLVEAADIFAVCLRLVRNLDNSLGTTVVQKSPTKSVRKDSMKYSPTIPQAVKHILPTTVHPNPDGVLGSYLTDGLGSIAAFLAVVIGLAAWYAVYSAGWTNQSLFGILTE